MEETTYLNRKLWGEIPSETEPPDIPDVRAEIEKCMSKSSPTDPVDDIPEITETFTLPPIDPLISYAITLHKHENEMNEIIRLAKLAIESNLIPPEDDVLPIPEMPIQEDQNGYKLPLESTGSILELSSVVVRSILTKSIATILAHIGYETTNQSNLHILTDVLHEFLTKLCYHLKIAEEDEVKGNLSGFPSAIERVLLEAGQEGTRGLYEFYNNRIVKYIPVLRRRCEILHKQYADLLKTKTKKEIKKIIEVKVEEDDLIEADTSHFSLAAIDGDLNFLSLETGFQLLNTLEAGTSAHTIDDGQEDVGIVIAPSTTTIEETDLSHLFSHSKRRKKLNQGHLP